MFLDQHPSVAAINQSTDELVSNIGMIGQCHFRRRKSANPAQRFKTKNCRKVVLPGLNVQAVVLEEWKAQPHVPKRFRAIPQPPIRGVARDSSQAFEDVVEPHRPQPMQERS